MLVYIPLSRIQACNKSHTCSPFRYCMTFITRLVRGRRDIKHMHLMLYTINIWLRPRACACIFHKTLSLMLYLLHVPTVQIANNLIILYRHSFRLSQPK